MGVSPMQKTTPAARPLPSKPSSRSAMPSRRESSSKSPQPETCWPKAVWRWPEPHLGCCGDLLASEGDLRLSAHGSFDQALWQFGASAVSAHGSFDQASWPRGNFLGASAVAREI